MACQGFYLGGFREGKKREFLAYFYLYKGVKWGYSDQFKQSPFEQVPSQLEKDMLASLTLSQKSRFAILSLIAGIGIAMVCNLVFSLFIEIGSPLAPLVGIITYVGLMLFPIIYISRKEKAFHVPDTIGAGILRLLLVFPGIVTIDLMLSQLLKQLPFIPWRFSVTILILIASSTIYYALLLRHKYRTSTGVSGENTVARHVIDGTYKLCFDGVDENGFGHATNPETNLRYLLNKDTLGYDPKELKEGQYFGARITRAHYVVEITEIIPSSPGS